MHTERDLNRLLTRVRRIKGQVEAIERGLSGHQHCSDILQQIAACRGAVNGLMAHVLEGHIREHVIDPARTPTESEAAAVEELARIVKTYLR